MVDCYEPSGGMVGHLRVPLSKKRGVRVDLGDFSWIFWHSAYSRASLVPGDYLELF